MPKAKGLNENSIAPRELGRPKVLVVLRSRDITALDHCVVDLRAKTSTNITRSGVIQALVAGFVNSKYDFADIADIDNLADALASKLSH